MAPAVSVVIPAHRAAYVDEALASVFQQGFSDYEVLLVNDGSPDANALRRTIQPYRDRLTCIEQENRGPGAARNAAIARARGEFLAFLDSDDSWLPHYLAAQISVLRRQSGVDLVYADALLWGDSDLSGRTFMETAPSAGMVTLESLLNRDCAVITSCVLVRRQSVIQVGGFDEDRGIIPCEDLDLWIRLAYAGCRMAYQRQVLARHRLHNASVMSNTTQLWSSQICVLRKALDTFNLPADTRELIARRIKACEAAHAREDARKYVEGGHFVDALGAVERANALIASRKLRAAAIGLRWAPRALRVIYRAHRVALRALLRFTRLRQFVRQRFTLVATFAYRDGR